MANVALPAEQLHLLPREESLRTFDRVLGTGPAWGSLLMQYRTSSELHDEWKVEAGNWLERARRLGFLDDLLRNILPQRRALGERAAGYTVHRGVTQWLGQAMITHYLAGTGWGFHAWEPAVTETGAEGTRAVVDLQFEAPGGVVVDVQVKASGRLGIPISEVDDHIQQGVRKAAAQLPVPATRPALIAVLAQRRWSHAADLDVVEDFVGNTAGYPDRSVLLHDEQRGELLRWSHVSGIVVLDHRRAEGSAYHCVVLQNPWAAHPVDPAWFPHARVLTHDRGVFTWLRGMPSGSTFPDGTRCAPGTRGDALH